MHDDIGDLSDDELLREVCCVTVAIADAAKNDPELPWLCERYRRVDAERHRRAEDPGLHIVRLRRHG